MRGHDPNLSACKREVQLLFAAIEAREAKRVKKKLNDTAEPSGSDARNPCTVFMQMSDSSFVEDYYAEANQKKLKNFHEGNADWMPVLRGEDRLYSM